MANRVDIIIAIKDAYSKGVDSLNNKLKSTAKDVLPSFATAFKIAAAAASAALVASVKAASDFESQMAEVGTMLDSQSRQILPSYAKAVSSMSVAFGEGTKTLTKGLYDILSASIPASKAIGVLEASVKAAKAGLTDTGVAADALTTIINSYNLAAEDATDVSDLLFSVVKRGKTTFAEIAPTIGLVASNAAAAGLSVEDMGAALATMTRGGIRTDNAITSLRAIINSVIGVSEESAKVFKDKVGYALDTTALKAKGLGTIIQDMVKAGLTPEQVAKIFPETRALTGINKLMGDYTGLLKDVDIMTKRAGATQEAYRINTNKFEHAFKQVVQIINEVRRVIGAAFLPFLNKMGENIVSNRKAIIEWAKTIGVDAVRLIMSLISTIKQLGPVLLPILQLVGMVAKGIIKAFEGVEMIVSTIINSISKAVGAMGVGLGKVIGALNKEVGAGLVAAGTETMDAAERDWMAKISEIQNRGKQAMKGFEGLGIEVDVDLLGLDPETLAAQLGEVEQQIAASVQKKFEYDQWYAENKQALDAELSTLAEMAGTQTLDMKLAVLESEIEAERSAVLQKLGIRAEELAQDQKYAQLGVKLQDWENKAKRQLIMAYYHERFALAQEVAQDLLGTTIALLGGEQEAFKKRKALTIALIAAEKALAIAKIWTANAVNPIAAAAKTALISAQFAAQIKSLNQAAAGAESVPGVTAALPAGITGGGAPLPTTAGGAPMAAAAAPVITNVYLGGVTNQFDIDRLESLELENLDNLMTQIGQKVEDLAVSGVQMAMKIHRVGRQNEGLATA